MVRLSTVFCLLLLAAGLAGSAPATECRLGPDELDALVKRFAPVLAQTAEIPAPPEKMLYRAAIADGGRTLLLAYHIVWPYEQDPRPGFWPAVTRLYYTGGLKLQRVIYGPGDVEVLVLTIDLATAKIVRVNYETATYDAKGGVVHVPLQVESADLPGYEPLFFRVISWNHLFKLESVPPAATDQVIRLEPQPFSDQLWSYYRMTKKAQGPLSLDRDHPAWEDGEDLCCPRRQPAPKP
jgi:hypothetical protein